ncbi:MAG: RHS repeat-associated core domain-containing protein, partial [Clostridia bacterium]|nr:RHS repeat-associated core domain-containing protein [Clostridia bacterium]
VGFNYWGTDYYYVKNLQGDVYEIYRDDYGTLTCVAKYVYDAWGNILAITDGSGTDVSAVADHIANVNPIRYRSYYYDRETNLYYLETRYYDPETGRFLNADSIDYLDPETLTGLNLYAYCINNPVMYLDSSGTFWSKLKEFGKNCLKAAVVVVSVVGAVATVAAAIAGTISSGGAGAVAIPAAIAVAAECVAVATAAIATIGVVSVATAEIGSAITNMIGENGTPINSHTPWRSGQGVERIDVENPAPGKRDGQIHYHDPKDKKYMYDFATRQFQNPTSRLRKLFENKDFLRGIKKAYKKLGERW